MGSIKVFGHPASTATRRVLITLHEKELDFELVLVDLLKGEHKKEPFISRNPFGKIPAFQDGDFKLFESRAITQYLAHDDYMHKGTQLLSLGSKNMAIMAMGLEIEAHEFDPIASKLAWEQIFKGFYGLTTDQSIVEDLEAKLAFVLDNYEIRLKESKYLSCDSFTLADLHHIPVIQYLLGTPTKKLFDERPHVSAWVTAITSRPSAQKVL